MPVLENGTTIRVGFVFQSLKLVASLSARDNIVPPVRLDGRHPDPAADEPTGNLDAPPAARCWRSCAPAHAGQTFVVPGWHVAIAVLATGLLGVLASVIPSVRAARVDVLRAIHTP
ncbi:MAG TPA: hypothetical protein VFZ70_08490 [Euzebyales bacterium]